MRTMGWPRVHMDMLGQGIGVCMVHNQMVLEGHEDVITMGLLLGRYKGLV